MPHFLSLSSLLSSSGSHQHLPWSGEPAAMAPHGSSVHIRLAEPVVFLRNLDSATDRRERRAQRRRAQQAQEALTRSRDQSTSTASNPPHLNGPSSLFGGADQTYVPPHGRGGAGSRSRDRSNSQARSRSASRGRALTPSTGVDPSRSPSAAGTPRLAEAVTSSDARGRSSAPRREAATSSNGNSSAGAPQPQYAPRDNGRHNLQPTRSRGNARPVFGPHLHERGMIQDVQDGEERSPSAERPPDVDHTNIELTRPPAIIRGVMTVHLAKSTRIKKIGIRLRGQSKTEWPEGLGPRRLDTFERNSLIDQTVYFLDATTSPTAHSRRASSLGPGSSEASNYHQPARASSLAPAPRSNGWHHDPVGQATPEASISTSRRSSADRPILSSQASSASTVPRSDSPEPMSQPVSERGPAPLYSPDLPPGVKDINVPSAPRAVSRSSSSGPPAARSVSASRPGQIARTHSPLVPHDQQHHAPHAVHTPAHHPHHHAHHAHHRNLPHELFQDRAAELRAQAAGMSPPPSPTVTSPTTSRASSLYDRPLTTADAVSGDTTGSSRPASLTSHEDPPSGRESQEAPAHMDAELFPPSPVEALDAMPALQHNASRISLSSTSDADHASLHEEERGRSPLPVGLGRERGTLTNETILEDRPGEDYEGGTWTGTEGPSPEQAVSSVQQSGAVVATSTVEASADQHPSVNSAESSAATVKPAASALRDSSTSSTKRNTTKSARFSLGSLIGRDKSTSRTRQADAHQCVNEKRGSSSSHGGLSGLQAIKNALTPHSHQHDEKPHHPRPSTSSSYTPDASDVDTDSDDESHRKHGRSGPRWVEYKAGTYTFPIYFPIPLSLPPTIHSNHGQVTYMLKGFVNRAGALTTNMSTVSEVHVVAAPHEDDLEAIESIIVERMWETQLNYKIVIHCKSIPIGGQIPVSIRLNPLSKMKLFRLSAVLEERFTIYAKERRLARNETTRRYDLIKVQNDDGSALLPIISEDPDAIQHSMLHNWIADAASTDGTGIQTLDPFGPWVLESTIPIPDCSSTLQFSTSHEKANTTVIHSLKIILRVERGDDEFMDGKGNRKKFDIIVEAPMHILSCRTAVANALPTYTTDPNAVTNPFGVHTSASIDSSAFHPHELSDAERHAAHYRGVNTALHAVQQRSGNSQMSRSSGQPSHNMSAAATGISDTQLREALVEGAGGSTENPPPSYEAARRQSDGNRSGVVVVAV